jgi:asparagine synthase (glutamine-hydrolysing)
MCGIAGILTDGRVEEARAGVRAMMDAARHRGPDGSGSVEIEAGEGRLVLGHRRLSIIDLSEASREPMRDEATGAWVVFNGEIYNFRELRRELEGLGEKFKSTGDTEVLLRALVTWGAAALEKIDGMFAFAFWDERRRELLLARDRMGIKPLYYWRSGRKLAFASEVKILELAGLGALHVDLEAVDSFLAYGAVSGPKTIYREIRELPPGHLLRVAADGEVAESEYWSLNRVTKDGAGRGASQETFDDAVARVRVRLEAAVEAQLVSDVPVGVFLSGGVDSSLLALMASRKAKSPITFLTVAFAEQEFSELPHAQAIAKGLPHHHEVVTLSGEQLRELLPAALGAMDQPTLDGINTFVISRVGAGRGLKVLLSGVGGDELFGGYTTFSKVPRLWKYGPGLRPAAKVLSQVGKTLSAKNAIPWKKVADAGRLENLADAYLLQRSVRWRQADRKKRCAELQESVDGMASDFQKIAALELAFYMRYQLLRDSDVFSMANSVELRVPFLDTRLVETALEIAREHHFQNGRGKRITWKILRDLAGDVPQRRKMGFTFPWQKWLGRELKETISATLREKSLYEPVAVDPGYGEQVLSGLESGDRLQSWSEVWSLFVLLNWQSRTRVQHAAA